MSCIFKRPANSKNKKLITNRRFSSAIFARHRIENTERPRYRLTDRVNIMNPKYFSEVTWCSLLWNQVSWNLLSTISDIFYRQKMPSHQIWLNLVQWPERVECVILTNLKSAVWIVKHDRFWKFKKIWTFRMSKIQIDSKRH